VSAYGEMVALLWQAGNEAAALELETRWNALQADLGFALLCSYPRSVLRGSALPLATQLCREHTDSALRGDNPVALAASDHGFSEVFVPSPSAVPAARNFVRRALHTAEPAVEAADVVLVACELVTNAVRHAASAFCLRVAGVNNAVRLEIEDTSPRSPTPRPVSASAVGGRGLALVDSLTNAWGHYATSSGGKVVWAEFTA
jgi:anti-sigma regulatory factor (Ser/Thr protein kinase)